MEPTHSNRMLLAAKSGIDEEINWALDRISRLTTNEYFTVKGIPSLLEALYEWPEWYAEEGYKATNDTPSLFAPNPQAANKRRHAIECLHILKSVGLNEAHAQELLWTVPTLPLSSPNPIPRLNAILPRSSDRSLIMGCFSALSILLSNPANASNLSDSAPSIDAAIRYLPLFREDIGLVDECLNFLYAHLSNMAMSTAFLLRPEISGVLKIFVNILLADQVELDTLTHDVSGVVHTTPSTTVITKDHELTKEELDALLEMPEPQRCYEWMKTMFVAKQDGELTQVEFWNLYKDIFMQFQDRFPLLVASEAMVLPGNPARFVVRGVDRRKDIVVAEKFKCRWDRSACGTPAFKSARELYDHLLEHLKAQDISPCKWSKCTQKPLAAAALRVHCLTHIASSQPAPQDASQSDTITLPSATSQYPIPNPTTRPLPPARDAVITYKAPRVDPSSTALTSLLCIRSLFRASFAYEEAAPRHDADHFGFPGIVEGNDDEVTVSVAGDREKEAARKGRKPSLLVKPLLNTMFLRCVKQFNAAQKEDVRRAHCLETLQISLRCMFNKNPSGWEVMEIMAGGVGQSDEYFMFIKTPDTEQFTFEASLLLALLANYHKSDAAKLNPYLQRIRQADDKDLIRQICWASNFALQAAINRLRAYQEVSDDSPPTFTSTLASMVVSMRPDRALASKPLDPPRELFKSLTNPTFNLVLIDYLSPDLEVPGTSKLNHERLPSTILTLSSYLITHASSTASPRAAAYANLCLSVLLAFVENEALLGSLTPSVPQAIRLCRQVSVTGTNMVWDGRLINARGNHCYR
ncbi:Chromatin structure-remodeling complex protein [Salix suchowensis]|nr:Chromatin structure-remodeling complex protein [Salix suchowensis]